jgi:hypothetical protein
MSALKNLLGGLGTVFVGGADYASTQLIPIRFSRLALFQ